MNKMKDKAFNLDDSLLRDYPEMQALSGMQIRKAPKDAWPMSAAYVNLRTVERCLPDVEAGQQTNDIEYLLKIVGECLDELAATGKYVKFVSAERQKLDQLSTRASDIIGTKVRGSDSIYK